jgi:hypothetical protein
MFNSESVVKKTRKIHDCEQCLKKIEVGSQCLRFAGYYEDFYYGYSHEDCHEAWGAWPGRECLNSDESAPLLHELEKEDWPWLKEAFPTVSARMGFK